MIQHSKKIEYTDLQSEALDKIEDWYKTDSKFYVLGGYAGSGKSTIAKEIKKRISNCYFVAYTGKAAHVLREKGVGGASTIHSFLYDYQGKDENGDPVFLLGDHGLIKEFLLIIDEYSMLSQQVIDDILSKCPKVLFIGDPMQLPPIGSNKQILRPDFFLDEIHRQAADNPIVKWAHGIRNGNMPKIGLKEDGFEVISMRDVDAPLMDTVEQVICGKNETRFKMNQAMRKNYGFSEKSKYPVRGDKLICLKNNHAEGLYNGMIFVSSGSAKDNYNGSYQLNVNGKDYDIWGGDVLGQDPKTYSHFSRQERFDYAYAITAHKAQGSDFESVLVYDQSWGATKINWLYTAVTRARSHCILAI